MKTKILKRTAATLSSLSVLALASCWSPPNANVQPEGEPGLIQKGVKVDSVKDPAIVQAVDASARTLTLKLPDKTVATYKVGAQVENFGAVQVGNQVAATVAEELDIYLLANGRLPDGTTAESLGVNAKVLKVDPSYRILTLQYPNGESEQFKPGLETRMLAMAPGDSVVVRPLEVTKINIEKP